jgi:hypothetical protein
MFLVSVKPPMWGINEENIGPIRLIYNSYYSTSFFNRKNIFLLRQISKQSHG